METALRETEEEAGLKKENLKIMQEYTNVLKYMVKGRPKVVVYFLAELLNEAPVVLSHEHQAFEWAPLDRACTLVGYKEMKNTLVDCDAHLRSSHLPG